MKRVKIINGKVITPFRIINNGIVTFEDGKIIDVSKNGIDLEGCTVIDAQNNYVSPGFVDIHTHGGGGFDFMDGTCEAYLGAAEKHAQHGTTSLVPTTLTSTNEELENTFNVFKAAKALNKKGARFIGIHLEGPYFAMSQRGAQDPRYIKTPLKEEYEEILGWSKDIVRWSAARSSKEHWSSEDS